MLSIYQQIEEWSQGRRPWQRDALRRVVRGGVVSETDVNDLTAICLSAHKLGTSPLARPLLAEDLPSTAVSALPVTIVSLSDLVNIDVVCTPKTRH